MVGSDKLPSFRALILLGCVELIFAGILWTIGLINPILFIILGLIGFLAVWLWDERKLFLFWTAISFGFLVTVGFAIHTVYFAKPKSTGTVTDLEMVLIVESVRGDDIVAHFAIRNHGAETVHINTFRYLVPNQVTETAKGLPRQIAPDKEIIVEVERRNKLAQVRTIELEMDYGFGRAKAKIPAYARFYVPTNVLDGEEISPTFCCERNQRNIYAKSISEMKDLFQRNDAEISLNSLSDFDVNGAPIQLSLQSPTRRFIIESAKRRVLFQAWHTGGKALFAPFGLSPDVPPPMSRAVGPVDAHAWAR